MQAVNSSRFYQFSEARKARWRNLLERSEKIEHHSVELIGPLHIQGMRYIVHDDFPGARNTLLQPVYRGF